MKSLLLLVMIGSSFFSGLGLALAQTQTEPLTTPNYTYEVPVSEELAPFATFAVPEYKRRLRPGKIEIEYTLPLELTGEPLSLSFEGRMPQRMGDELNLRGPHGVMSCLREICVVEYRGLDLDFSKVRQHLEGLNLSAEELRGRLLVAEDFIRDPIGILKPVKAPVRPKLVY